MSLPLLPADKANHLAYGALLACLGSFHSALAGAVFCAILAVIKEAADFYVNGTPSWADFAATVAGGALVLVPLLFQSA